MNSKPMLKSKSVILLSMFGIGFCPFAPGTMASIATAPFLYILIKFQINLYYFSISYIILLILSIYLSQKIQKKYHIHDPSWIVIDEFLGLLTMYPFIKNDSFIHILTALILFRFFDIIKFWPASYFDKNIKHGAGVIIDDVISGIYAGLIYLIIIHFKLI